MYHNLCAIGDIVCNVESIDIPERSESSLCNYFYHNEVHLIYDVSQPLWVLKTAKEKFVQRLVHMSADLARQVGMMLEDSQNGIAGKVNMDSLFSVL
jgi:hypothetical protein